MAVLLLALLPLSPKLSKSTSADKHQRRINAQTLQLVFELLFEPLRWWRARASILTVPTGRFGGASRSSLRGLRIIWKTVALHGVKSNSCPKCKVLPWELGNDAKYSARDYTEYEYCERENGLQSLGSDSDDANEANVTFDTLRINLGPSFFHGLYRVSAPDLHVPDLLYTIYLGLFKHLMDWIQGFLKKHGCNLLLSIARFPEGDPAIL